MIEVTQADRDAAWRFRPSGRLRREVWDNGIYDDHPSIQSFADHRVATEAKIVDLLRKYGMYEECAAYYVELIAQKEHLK